VPPISAAAMLSRKAREHPDDHQQHKRPEPAFGQQLRQHLRHAAVLEVACQQRKADQQAEQIDQQNPFVRHVRPEAGDAVTGLEAGDRDLVQHNHRQTAQRHLQHMVMEQRHAEQRRREQDEVHGIAEKFGAIGGPGRRGQRQHQGTARKRMTGKLQTLSSITLLLSGPRFCGNVARLCATI
jgi:hypothetical protein